MSLKTLPLIFINLGGEMIYILDQRLMAQNIPRDKAKKVLEDIISTMFNKRFMEDLFKPQELYSKKAMRTVFDKLAHASIMRLNSASMNKLYDLMTMAVKYQVYLSMRPADILLVTLNHMDTIMGFISDSATIRQQVEYVFKMLVQHYGSLSPGEFHLIRQTLLTFFQDVHIRVSIFLKDKVQGTNGKFNLPLNGPVPVDVETPGKIRIFQSHGDAPNVIEFPAGDFSGPQQEGSLELKGDRVTKLGLNMYSVTRTAETTDSETLQGVTQRGYIGHSTSVQEDPVTSQLAQAELNLLAHLMGNMSNKDTPPAEFKLNFFGTDEEEEEAEKTLKAIETQIINIDASKGQQNEELTRIMGTLTVGEDESKEESSLLELMDSTA